MPRAMYEEPVIIQHAAGVKLFYCASPDAVRHVMLKHPDAYPKARLAQLLLNASIGRGLLMTHGEEWRRQRRAAAPMFQHRSLAAYGPLLAEEGRAMAEVMQAASGPVDVSDLAADATYNAILRAMFAGGVRFDPVRLRAAIRRYLSAIGRLSLADLMALSPLVPRPRRVLAWPARLYVHRELSRFIAERRASGAAGDDLLGRLISARDPQTGAALDDIEIRDNLLTLIVAGHETTALTISWALYLISMSPAVEARLLAEIDSVFAGRGDDLTTADDLARLPYLEQVLNETLRLYPAAPVLLRVATEDDVICGEDISAGDPLLIAVYALHRHKTAWETPEAFDPDRFAPDRPRPDRFQFLPFGAGPRICIGAAFAMMEASLILVEILRKGRVRVADGADVRTQMALTLRPRAFPGEVDAGSPSGNATAQKFIGFRRLGKALKRHEEGLPMAFEPR